MSHSTEDRTLYFGEVIRETQTYLHEVLDENENLQRTVARAEVENLRLESEKLRLERQLALVLERLSNPHALSSQPVRRLVWTD